jgi:hypothetical protein
MPENLQGDTQPVNSESLPTGQSMQRPRSTKLLAAGLIGAVFLATAVAIGGLAGYYVGNSARDAAIQSSSQLSVQEQFDLGVQDLQAGNYEVALQRFEYVVSVDPSYPGVTEYLSQAMQVVYTTATPVPGIAEPTPTATRDARPVLELFDQAINLIINQDWTSGLDTLINLRKEAPELNTARVDGLLYLALRSRGVQKILEEANLVAGTYDLALADNFGPLDRDAKNAQEWARLYMVGLSFWEVHPEQAVNYFGQLAAAAPFLSDSSGWTAMDRYRVALITYGDYLAQRNDWCAAYEQYSASLAIRYDATVETTAKQAEEKCLGITPTITAGTASPSPTITLPGNTPSPSATQGVPATSPVPPTTTVPGTTPTSTKQNPTATTQAAPTTAAPPATTEPPPQETQDPYPPPDNGANP